MGSIYALINKGKTIRLTGNSFPLLLFFSHALMEWSEEAAAWLLCCVSV